MVPLAFGTQTAGSVIRPASFCGIAGFKPAHGWRSTAGIKRLSERLDTLGLLARSVADVALLGGFAAPAPASREGRVAFCRTPWWDEARGRRPGRVRGRGCAAGARRSSSYRRSSPASPVAQETAMAFDVARNLEPEWREHRDGLSDAMRDYISRGREVTSSEVEAAVAMGERCRSAFPGVLAGFDALLVPGVLGEAPLRSEGHTGSPLLCRAWTFLGVPAISVPGLSGPAGMPVGVQLVGVDSAAVLGVAASAERSLRG